MPFCRGKVQRENMRDAKKKGKKALNVAIYILLGTWIVLLALLAAIYWLRLQGYNSFKEWQEREQNVTQTEGPFVITAVPTGIPKAEDTTVPTAEPTIEAVSVPEVTATPVPTVLPEVTVTPTLTPEPTKAPVLTPTPSPTPVPVMVTEPENALELHVEKLEETGFSGIEGTDQKIRELAAEFAGEEEVLICESYAVGNYYSVVFRKTDEFEGEETEYLLPLVYDLSTGEQVTGSGLIKESYFAIVKERLQKVVARNFPSEAKAAFTSYEQAYRAEDYQQFYLTEEHLVFYFGEDTLTENRHKPFTYVTELEEAKAFFYFNLDGTTNGIAIRKLDPEKPMIAFTYDDGPAYKYDLDRKLMDLFEQYDGRLTFFFLGDRISGSFKEVVRESYERGHEVASHTYSHINMGTAKPEVVWPEVNKTNLKIAEVTGHVADYVRLPGGTNGKYLSNLPMPIINWDIDTIDWRDKDKDIIFERMKKKSKDGGIVLIHSIHLSSYEASELLIPWLAEQGYQFVTLSELFYYKGVVPENGVEYDGFSGNE